MLQAFGLSYEPSPLVGNLFEDVHLSLDPGEIVVLMGRNGCGKTKLLEILCGVLEPGSGRVIRDRRCRIGYLRQDIELDFVGSLESFLRGDGSAIRPDQIARACARVGLDLSAVRRSYETLSVGERLRASLARLLLDEPTVLLLDEPTNHLDQEGREWLVSMLEDSGAACLLVTHDRAIANRVADRVLVLEGGALHEFAGGYDDMVVAREQELADRRETYERQRGEERRLKIVADRMARNAARMTRRPTGRTYDPKAKAFYAGKEAKMFERAKAVRSRIEQMLENRAEKPLDDDEVQISFNTRPLRHSDALTARNLRKAYGSRELFKGLSVTVGAGDRIALVGPNGSGKTTLMRILLGEDTVDCGEVHWAEDALPAFLTQERTRLDIDLDVLAALHPESRHAKHFVRTLLARLRMRGDAAMKPLRVLSVGERTKVELVAILMTAANVLLLDEPTNHLDVESLEALEGALKDFTGAILFTSHDQAFIDRVATGIVRLGSS